MPYYSITGQRRRCIFGSLQVNGGCLSQAELEKIIRTHLARLDVTVELGKELVAIEQDQDGVTATILTHDTETKEIVRADYLVGADGARGIFVYLHISHDNDMFDPIAGSTRKLLGLTFQGETRDADGMIWGDVEIPNLPSDVSQWHIPSSRV